MMKFRILEFKPRKYKAQRKYLVFWRTIVKAVFVDPNDAEDSINLYKRECRRKKAEKRFKKRVVRRL
jgi:hypothetical protein